MDGRLREGSAAPATRNEMSPAMTTRTEERRSTPGTVELRAKGDGPPAIGGYALKFDTLSQNLGGFVETIAHGALDKTLADGGDVMCRYQHEDHFLLGRTSSDTLTLTLDQVGLLYEVQPPATTYADNVLALVGRGDVKHSSFAMRVMEDDWSFTEQGFPLRTIRALSLVDVAPVVNPAYLDTSTGLRSLAEVRGLDLGAVTAAAKSNTLAELLRAAEATTDNATGTPGETHGLIAIRRRRAELDQRRTS